MEYDPEQLKVRLASLPPLALTAIACATAERVNPVYEKYWVGSHLVEVRQAIDLGWQVCAGATPQPGLRERMAEFIEDLVEYLYEEGITILAEAAAVSLAVLETLQPDVEAKKEAAERALGSSLYVVQLAAHVSKAISEDVASDEELTWQDLALNLVARTRGPWTREDFRSLGADPPAWWIAYDGASKHL